MSGGLSRPKGWTALWVFWGLAIAGLGAGAFVLHRMGPPDVAAPQAVVDEPPVMAEPAPVPVPSPIPLLAEGPSMPAPVIEPPAAPVEPAVAEAPAMAEPVAPPPAPAAPSPPPLAGPAPAQGMADRPIAPVDPALTEPSRHGPLPKVGADGRTSIRVYARPFDRADQRPRIAIVVGNIGLNAPLSEDAIRRLPSAATLAFSPYAPRNAPLLDRARARGMETLTALPLEPTGYPLNDPGDRALLTGNPPSENADRLDWALSRIQGQVGAIGALGPLRGERFAAVPEMIGQVQDTLRGRGLLYLDPRPGAGTPARAWGRGVDLVVDDLATRGEIERRLAELERIARDRGSALGLASDPAPVVVERIAAWAAGLEQRGFVLTPVTMLIRRGDNVPRPEASR
ncbi:divergent polysaccharide deacetylase family protein [Humitalea sp. 24SJ18S-53]|uniref:divergent polysaccharide deacetylase family protein n=1 Tax=Humitalea sp. 24SJ18S-53 TaxID=3422307 RepID=UPI003D67C794